MGACDIRRPGVPTWMEMISHHRRMRGLVAISIMLTLAACSPTPDRSSPIVQKAEAAGAGDLATASAPSIEDWMGKHRDLAVELDGMCKPARQKGDAKWLDTTEGRL